MSKEVNRIAVALCALLILFGSAATSHGQNAPSPVHHKIQVDDPALAATIAASGGRLIADYGGYKLYDAPLPAGELAAGKAELRDDYNSIFLNAARMDTSKPEIQALRKMAGPFAGRRMHLVHFAGPVQPGWRKELLDAGAQIVSYIPQNAYLVYGDSAAIARVQALAAGAPHIQWDGPYLDDYKIQPAARGATAGDHFAIQLIQDAAANPETLKLIDHLKLAPLERLHPVLNYVDIVARIAPANLAQIASRPDVVAIQRFGTPKKVCERQDQIVAGNLSGNVPSGPGYLAWLQGKGFTQEQFNKSAFVVDIADSGIDDGTTSRTTSVSMRAANWPMEAASSTIAWKESQTQEARSRAATATAQSIPTSFAATTMAPVFRSPTVPATITVWESAPLRASGPPSFLIPTISQPPSIPI